jgi:serine/threonine-protein kinase
VQGERLDAVDSVGSRVQRLQIVQKICDAVAFAHARGIIHRDLKPSNVMIGPFGEVLVMDWGLARILSDAAADSNARLTSQPTAIGTPGFTAPEIILGQDSGPRADIFSLGVILNFMLSRETNEPIPRRLKSIVEKASAKQPSDRYESVHQMADDIAQYLQGGPVSAYPENAAERAWRWMVGNRAWILLILAYLLMRTLFVLWRKYF